MILPWTMESIEKEFMGQKNYEIELREATEVINGYFIKPVILFGKFKWSQQKLDEEVLKGTKVSIKTLAFSPSYERIEYEPEVPWNLISPTFDVKTNESASTDLKNIFGKKVFDFPKPPSLIEYIANFLCEKDDIILDSFAGSGTTAHAVLNLNKQDGGNRKFILVEMEDYANDITAERVKRVANGYGSDNKKVEGTGGTFDYYELGLPLFDENQNLNEEVGLPKIREYIWFSETRTSIYDFGFRIDDLENPKSEIKNHQYFLGQKDGTVYYFIYEKEELTTLDYNALELIKTKGEQYIIYADNCLLPKEFMAKKNVIFKKIPRDITRF